MIKLIGIDVDGTLLDSRGEVPQENLDAIGEAAARAIHVAIVTGRSFFFALPKVARLPDPLTLIVHNGAIARLRTGETFMRRLLPRAVARDLLLATAAWRDCSMVLFDRPRAGQVVFDRLDWEHPRRLRYRELHRDLLEQVDALEDAMIEDPIQIAFNGCVSAMRELASSLAAHPLADAFSWSLTEYEQRDFSLVDVCAAGTTKATALAAVAERLGVKQNEVMAVGDNYNDREMLRWAGTGVVMANAAPELRSGGFHSTGSNDNAGLAQAIRAFALS